MTSAGYALLLAAVFLSQATAVEVNEAVLEDGASGTAVVLLSVAHIQQAAIFPDDNQLLRRIAYVETRDGVSLVDEEGGIWAVSETAFESTKDTSNALLPPVYEQILQQLNIAWQSAQLSDLRRPLYSALAARLVLFIAPQTIPSDTDVTGQAQFWRENYNTNGSEDEFTRAVEELQGNQWSAFGSSASDFYIGFACNEFTTGQIQRTTNLQLFVSTREPDPVPFTVDTLLGFSFTGVATRDSTSVVLLDSNFQVFNVNERNKGIHVSAGDKQIVVYGSNTRQFTSDAFLALPCPRLPVDQYEYYAVTYYETGNSQMLLVGCEDDTTITFDSTTVILNQMETYLHEIDIDITGMRVVSNKPISFFSGNQCTFVPVGSVSCDHLVEQIPPTSTWGTTFLSASFNNRMSGELYRILASQPSTTVTVNCTTYTQPETYSLSTAGAWQEFMAPDDSFCVIESDKPLLVMEFALGNSLDGVGDPFMMMIPPIEQYSNDYVFNVLPQFSTNFITMFVPPEYYEPEKIFVDDVSQELALWTTIHCLNSTVCGYAGYASLTVGGHRLYHSDEQARIGVSVYGFIQDESYGYPGGLQLAPVQLAAISFSQESYTVSENEETLNVSVVRSGNIESEVVVLVANRLNQGSATAGQDYLIITEILEFPQGVTEMNVEISIIDDMSVEMNETIVLYLSSGAGALLSPVMQTEVIIVSNDDEVDSGAIGVSIAVAVVMALLIISGCVIAGIAFWGEKKKKAITVAVNNAYNDAMQDTAAVADNTSLSDNAAYGGASQIVRVAPNTAYDHTNEDVTVDQNSAAYENIRLDTAAAHNESYEDVVYYLYSNNMP